MIDARHTVKSHAQAILRGWAYRMRAAISSISSGYGPSPQSRTPMIRFGEGWSVDHGRLVHMCRPGTRTLLIDDCVRCDCGAQVPRRVSLFRAWQSTKHPPGGGVLAPQPLECDEVPLCNVERDADPLRHAGRFPCERYTLGRLLDDLRLTEPARSKSSPPGIQKTQRPGMREAINPPSHRADLFKPVLCRTDQ
jgi:hypothetical protein